MMKRSNGEIDPPAGKDVLRVEDIVVSFGKHRTIIDMLTGRPARQVCAVNGVSFGIKEHETLGLVGESGSGKTTLGRLLLKLYSPTSGRIIYKGRDITAISGSELRTLRRDMQMVFQDPYSSLNPRLSVSETITEVLMFHSMCSKGQAEAELHKLLNLVGLSASMGSRRPQSLSGGQRQRVGLARALALRPSFLVLDEPVAALDVSVQAQILNLLNDLRDELGLTMLFIAHELSVVRHMSSHVAVMYLGKIVEIGTTREIFETPSHPYTLGLMRSVPQLVAKKRRRKPVLEGEVPSPLDMPSGCSFHPRCPDAQEICRLVDPQGSDISDTHVSRCHFPANNERRKNTKASTLRS